MLQVERRQQMEFYFTRDVDCRNSPSLIECNRLFYDDLHVCASVVAADTVLCLSVLPSALYPHRNNQNRKFSLLFCSACLTIHSMQALVNQEAATGSLLRNKARKGSPSSSPSWAQLLRPVKKSRYPFVLVSIQSKFDPVLQMISVVSLDLISPGPLLKVPTRSLLLSITYAPSSPPPPALRFHSISYDNPER